MPCKPFLTSWQGALRDPSLPKFMMVGFLAVAIDGLVYWAVNQSGSDYQLSKMFGFIAGTLFSYFANSQVTFNAQPSPASMLKFLTVYASALAINVLGNSYLITLLPQVSGAVAFAFVAVTAVTTIWNYLGMAFWVFKRT